MPALTPDIIFLIVLILAMLATYKEDKLTTPGIITGGVLAAAIYMGVGYIGIAMLGAFFFLSVLATSHRKAEKRKLPNNEPHHEKRNAGQVIANGGLAALLGLIANVMPGNAVIIVILIAAAFASATADTLSSELGTVYGSRFYNIMSFKLDEKGRDGVISLEGTLIGLAGSAVIAIIYSVGFGWNVNCLFIVIAGTIGNLSDSILGATLERGHRLNNNAVNFLNTAMASLICLLMVML